MMMNEDNLQKSKLLWRCRRGMLELDVVLERFIKTQFEHLTSEQKTTLETLLTYPDPVLYAWLMGSDDPTDVECNNLVKFIRAHHNAK